MTLMTIPSSVSGSEVVPGGETPAKVDESLKLMIRVDGLDDGNLLMRLWLLLLLEDRHGKRLCRQGAPRHLNSDPRVLF